MAPPPRAMTRRTVLEAGARWAISWGAAWAGAGSGLLGGGCDRPAGKSGEGSGDGSHDPSPGSTGGGGKGIPLFATVYPVADLARQVGGPLVAVQWYAELGRDPERPEGPSPEWAKRLEDAAVILTSGWGDDWIGERFSDRYRAEHFLRPEYLDAARQSAASNRYGDLNLRAAWWLDPPVMKELMRALAERLASLGPPHAPTFRGNAEALAARLDALSEAYRSALAPYQGRRFLSLPGPLPPLWGPLARRYGLSDLAPVASDPSRLDDSDWRQLKDAAAVTTTTDRPAFVVVSADVPSAVVEQLGRNLGLKAVRLDPLGTSAATGNTSYFKLMRYNLAQLLEGFAPGA